MARKSLRDELARLPACRRRFQTSVPMLGDAQQIEVIGQALVRGPLYVRVQVFELLSIRPRWFLRAQREAIPEVAHLT